MQQTTIAAIATAQAPAGIGIIRLSGPQALEIAASIVRPRQARRQVAKMAGYTGMLGRVLEGGEEIDEAVLFVYRAPHSYTGEDVAEICCHGGPYMLRRVLGLCLKAGAVAAGPGEFTRRAYLAGKLSLTQAEAVAQLIAAGGKQEARAALAARDGVIYREMQEMKAALVHLSASLAAYLDYPDEEQEEVLEGALRDALQTAAGRLREMVEGFEKRRFMREGILTVIAGRPNVGKSTLMNLLAGTRKSIVTDIPGTTRDVVEAQVALGDTLLRLCDTAGLRQARDPVEEAGVQLARERLEQAQLVLAVFDCCAPLSAEDIAFIRSLAGKPVVAVINKVDLNGGADYSALEGLATQAVKVSAREGRGLEELEQAILRALESHALSEDALLLVSQRQRDCASQAHQSLREALDALAVGMTLDAVHICLDEAIAALCHLAGEDVQDLVVQEVFSHFCVGK